MRSDNTGTISIVSSGAGIKKGGSPSEGGVPALDGVRGIAILLVLVAHAIGYLEMTPRTALLHFLAFGWCGVDLFFVLSGFLITGILIRTREAVNRASSFYFRRFLRIFPIYYLALVALFAIAVWSPALRALVSLQGVVQHALFFLYLQNWLLMWNPLPHSIVGHFWSLAVEEQFYLIWPFVVWRLNPRSLMRACICGALFAFVLRVTLVWKFGPHFWIHALTLTRGEGLLIGSGLAAWPREIPSRILKIMASAGVAILLGILAFDPFEFVNTDYGPYMYTVGVTALGLLFGALVGSCRREVPPLNSLLTTGFLRNFGKYSYGLYVYHAPVYFLVTSVFASKFRIAFPLPTLQAGLYAVFLIGLSYIVAWLSFQIMESRFLRWKRLFAAEFYSRKN